MMQVCSEPCIFRYYRLFTAFAYFAAFCCQIPLLYEHLPLWIGVETSFNTYTPAVCMVIIGCAFFIVDRMAPKFGDKFRLQLWSGLLLMIGSSVWCICGISWSNVGPRLLLISWPSPAAYSISLCLSLTTYS